MVHRTLKMSFHIQDMNTVLYYHFLIFNKHITIYLYKSTENTIFNIIFIIDPKVWKKFLKSVQITLRETEIFAVSPAWKSSYSQVMLNFTKTSDQLPQYFQTSMDILL